MSDDAAEFMGVATGTHKKKRGTLANALSKEAGPKDIFEDEEDNVKPGQLVQYTLYGGGYVPATPTIKTLPPNIYRIMSNPNATWFQPHEVITDELLRLPDSKSDEVIAEIEKFWTLKEKFLRYGFSHRRGIMLWGPPGSGKTATISIACKDMVKKGGIVVLGDCHPNTLATMLHNLRTIEPDRPVTVLLEDIDTIIRNHGESEVLSLLDGEYTINNVVYIATTNYPENLDGRVINRPSRFDRIVKIDMPNGPARKLYLESRGIEGDVDKWVELTSGFSIAHIKELIIGVCCFGNKLEDEVKRLSAMRHTPKSSDGAKVGFGS